MGVKMNVISLLMYCYILLKPYYLFKSGGLQISDIVLLIAFFLFLILTVKNKKKITTEIIENKEYLIFAICTLIVNILYFVVYLKFKFVLSSLYYFFFFFVMILFSFCYKNNKHFGSIVSNLFKVNLIIQLLIYLLGLGRHYGIYRYMGTFNDPNQFAYFVLLSFSYIYLFDLTLKQNGRNFVYLLISVYLIYCSVSTGMLMGISVFVILYIVSIVKNFKQYIINNKVKLLIITFMLFFGIIFLVINKSSLSIFNLRDTTMFSRVTDKFNRISSKNTNDHLWSVWQERGYDKLWIYPQYMLYGSGEGEYDRFILSAHSNEIHATLPSILFYYGIIPFLIILKWFYKKLKRVPFNLLIVYLALLMESFTLLNQRQALFWTIFMMAPQLSKSYAQNKNV